MKVIKIGAVWCNGCLVMKPRWQEIEKEDPNLVTEYYDFDIDKETIEKYKVNSGVLPVFIFEDNQGKEIQRLTGEVEKEKLIQLIKEYKDR
jgi:thiol-disulfide isomerase/thioredoxin